MDHEPANRFGHADAHHALGLGTGLPGNSHDGLRSIYHLLTLSVNFVSTFTEAQLTGGSVKQPCP